MSTNGSKTNSGRTPVLREIFSEVRSMLLPVCEELADSETEQIIQHVLSVSRSDMFVHFRRTITGRDHDAIIAIARQRCAGTPLPYILGYAYFYSARFIVTPDVLLPRPDTETLIETVLKNEPREERLFADLGTGSGIIAATLNGENPRWRAIATDISTGALRVAKKNCPANTVFACMDRFFAIKKLPVFDFIVSNPPYISRKELAGLDRSVTGFEPAAALYGGEDGLDFYRYLARCGGFLLKNSGSIYCEIGSNQSESVTEIFTKNGWCGISLYQDLAQRPRVIAAKKRSSG